MALRAHQRREHYGRKFMRPNGPLGPRQHPEDVQAQLDLGYVARMALGVQIERLDRLVEVIERTGDTSPAATAVVMLRQKINETVVEAAEEIGMEVPA